MDLKIKTKQYFDFPKSLVFMIEEIKNKFKLIYGNSPESIFFCPGRVNLMGEHLDYNGGLVMPSCISLGTFLAISPNHDCKFRLKSLNRGEEMDYLIGENIEKKGSDWLNYPLGILKFLQEKGFGIGGYNLLYGGNIPLSSGLSSSASLEIVTIFSLVSLMNLPLNKLEMILMAKRLENEFIGLQSGIMDQFSVTMGEKDRAMVLNCQSLELDYIQFPLGDHKLVILNTQKPRELSDSKYNERVKECLMALEIFQTKYPIQNLCELNPFQFESSKNLIQAPSINKRAKHIIYENERVKLSKEILSKGDLPGFGKIMYESHNSLKLDYEVSGLELDTLISFCQKQSYVLGARMTGAGFGGCAIALVPKEYLNQFEMDIQKDYTEKIGYPLGFYTSEIEDGVIQYQ